MTTTSPIVVRDNGSGPLITIAIPTFNRAHWLKDCVATTLMQTYQRFEIVVSDNASTDETPRVLAEFDDQRLRVIRQQTNIGFIPNWNACLREAKGEYVVFLADDDRIKPWFLERCIGLIGREPQIPIMVALNDVYLAAECRTLPPPASRKLRTGIWRGVEILDEFLRGRISCTMCTIMFRTDVLRANGGLPTDWPNAADLACWMPLLMANSKCGLVNEACGTYCIHSETESAKFIVETRLGELQRLADLLAGMVHGSIDDPEERRKLQSNIECYLAVHAIALIASHRSKGATLAVTLSLIWKRRHELAHVKLGSISGLIRPIALIFLPRSITRAIRQLFHALRKANARDSTAPSSYFHARQRSSSS